MTNSCAAMGFASRMIVEPGSAPPTFDASSEPYAIIAENLTANRMLQGRNRITGDPSLRDDNVRQHSYFVQGSILLQPGPADLSNWLPRILGGTPSGTSYGLATSLPSFNILLDRENAIFRLDDCKVNSAVFRSRSAEGRETEELVTLQLNIIGTSEAIDDDTWPSPAPSLSFGGAYSPYAHWEGQLSLGGNVRGFDSFSLQINNQLRPFFRNSITPNCIRRSGARQVRLQTSNPFTTDTIDDAEQMLTTGFGSVLTFTQGGMSTSFGMAKLRNNYRSPTIRGKGEIPLELDMEAFSSLANAELAVTHDDTP